MSPELNYNQLASHSRVRINTVLEAQELEFATDIGEVDHYITPDGNHILVVADTGGNKVTNVFYQDGAENFVRGLKKGVDFKSIYNAARIKVQMADMMVAVNNSDF